MSREYFITPTEEWLSFLNRLQTVPKPVTAYDQMLAEFRSFVYKDRGLSPTTVEYRCRSIRPFLDQLLEKKRSLKTVTISHIDSILAAKVNREHYARMNGPAQERTQSCLGKVTDYRFEKAKRKNNPPAKIAAEGTVPLMPKISYEHSPRLAPALRFDPTGGADKLPELLAEAQRRALTAAEAKELAQALRKQEPWLEWAEKREKHSFQVDPVALHIHERVSPQRFCA